MQIFSIPVPRNKQNNRWRKGWINKITNTKLLLIKTDQKWCSFQQELVGFFLQSNDFNIFAAKRSKLFTYVDAVEMM